MIERRMDLEMWATDMALRGDCRRFLNLKPTSCFHWNIYTILRLLLMISVQSLKHGF
jgi:hypothetical protein